MINIRTIYKLKDGDGLTLKKGKPVVYKSGWQVADHGVQCTSAHECIQAVRLMSGNCGIWVDKGVYYIDHSYRVKTKRQAMADGKKYEQLSVFKWSNMTCYAVK